MPAATAAARVSRDLTVRTFEVRAESWDEKTRSFEAVMSTEAPVMVMDMQRWEPVEEVLVAKGCKMPKNRQVPLLDTHNRSSVKDGQLGSVRDIRIEGGQVLGRNFISSAEQGAATKVAEGHVTDCSVGYRPVRWATIEPGQTVEVEGRSYTAGPDRPLRVTTEWQLKENSLCPIGADEDAKVREEPAGGVPAQRKDGMNMPESAVPSAGAPVTPPVAPAPAPERAEAPKPEMTVNEVLRRDVLAITPPELEGFARGLLLQPDMTVEKARAALLVEFSKGKDKPVGSTEPEQPKRAAEAAPATKKLADVSDDVLARSLRG